jgi:thiol-disulfide isomerase/thioredoxin
MRSALLTLALLSISFMLCTSSKSPVTDLGDHNHDDFIKKNSKVIIMFYDPKCPYCKKMLPEFNKAADILQERNLDVKFGSVNLKQNPKLGDRRGIQYAPTVFYHEDNSESGIMIAEHTAVEIVNYLQRRFAIYSTLLSTLDETVKFAQLSDATGLYLGDESDPEFTIYRNFLEGYHHLHVSFGHIFNPKLVKELELSSDIKFTLFKKWDQNNADFKQAFTSNNLKEFINQESHPNVHPVSHKIMRQFMEKKTPFFVLFKKEEHSRSERAEVAFEEAATALKGTISFVVAGNKEEEDRHLAEMCGVPDNSYPQV